MANPFQSPQAESEPVAPTPPGLLCPRCGEQAMTAREKARLNPPRTALCAACGKRIGIGWRDFAFQYFAPSLAGWALGALPLAAWLFWLMQPRSAPRTADHQAWILEWNPRITGAVVVIQFVGLMAGFWWAARRIVRNARLIKR